MLAIGLFPTRGIPQHAAFVIMAWSRSDGRWIRLQIKDATTVAQSDTPSMQALSYALESVIDAVTFSRNHDDSNFHDCVEHDGSVFFDCGDPQVLLSEKLVRGSTKHLAATAQSVTSNSDNCVKRAPLAFFIGDPRKPGKGCGAGKIPDSTAASSVLPTGRTVRYVPVAASSADEYFERTERCEASQVSTVAALSGGSLSGRARQ